MLLGLARFRQVSVQRAFDLPPPFQHQAAKKDPTLRAPFLLRRGSGAAVDELLSDQQLQQGIRAAFQDIHIYVYIHIYTFHIRNMNNIYIYIYVYIYIFGIRRPLQSVERVKRKTSKSSVPFKTPSQTARPSSPKQPVSSPGISPGSPAAPTHPYIIYVHGLRSLPKYKYQLQTA